MADNHDATHVSKKTDFWTTEQYSQKVAPFVAQLTTRVVEMLNPKSDGIRSAELSSCFQQPILLFLFYSHVSPPIFWMSQYNVPSLLPSTFAVIHIGQCSSSLRLMLFLC
jgi:hypothetical protein